MTICAMCGNEFDNGSSCPYCGTFQHTISSRSSSRKRTVTTLNLEQGKPIVADALGRLDRELAAARMKQVRLIRVIHGWGSSGTGGAIKTAVHSHLQSLVRKGSIRSFTIGDHYSDYANDGRRLLSSYPQLRASLKTDRENPGITFVEV